MKQLALIVSAAMLFSSGGLCPAVPFHSKDKQAEKAEEKKEPTEEKKPPEKKEEAGDKKKPAEKKRDAGKKKPSQKKKEGSK